MIPEYAIREWNEFVPWTEKVQVEQDLIICRALVDIFSDEFLASQLAFSGEAMLTTYKLEELLGTKLRALYQRKKGRDLFDLYTALKNSNVNAETILECYKKYIEFVVDQPPTYKQFLNNMTEKMQDSEFLTDTTGLLRPEIKFDANDAYDLIFNTFIDKLPGKRD